MTENQPRAFVPFTVTFDNEQEAASLEAVLTAANRHFANQPQNSLAGSAVVLSVMAKMFNAKQIAEAAAASVAQTAAKGKAARNGKNGH